MISFSLDGQKFERTFPHDLTPKPQHSLTTCLSPFSFPILDTKRNVIVRKKQCIADAVGEQRRRVDLLDSLSGKMGGLLKFPGREAA
jgi:hypothetical protein